MDDKGPAHNLSTHIEELGDDTLTVILQREDAAEGDEGMDIVVLVTYPGHFSETDDEEHHHDDKTYNQIR